MASENAELIEYLVQVVPGAKVECAGCGVERDVSQAVVRDERFYCEEECADRANAVLRKQQPRKVEVDGWSI
jgi:hypothetical protein